MTRRWRIGGVYALPLLAVAAFVVLFAWGAQQIWAQRNLTHAAAHSGSWIAYQAEVEHARFLETLAAYARGAADVSHDDLLLRFDILWSRVPLLLDGPEAEHIRTHPDAAPLHDELMAALAWADPIVLDLAPGDGAKADRVRARLAPFAPRLHTLGIFTFHRDETDVVNGQAFDGRVKEAFALAMAAFLGVLAVGGVVIVMLVAQSRRARRAHERLVDAVEALSSGFVLFGGDGRLALCNTRYREFNSGLDDVLAPGARFEDLLAAYAERGLADGVGEGRDAWMARRRRGYREGMDAYEERQIDGRWLRISSRPTREGGSVSVCADITEHKRAEQALKESEERFRSITESSSLAMVIAIDQDGAVISVNSAVQRIFGYTKAEILGRPLTELMPERYRADHERGFRRAVNTENYRIIGRSVELHGLRKNGEEFPLELSLGVWRQGGAKYFGAIINDITERKRAELALQESEARYRMLTESTNVVPWELDLATWCFTYVGPQAEQLFGYPLEDWYKKDFWADHLAPEDRDFAIKLCNEATKRGDDHDFVYRMIAADGREVWVRDIVTVVKTNGVATGLRGVLSDFTERKQVERQLLEAKEAAEKASRAKSEFLASMSHELRTPLNAVLGFAEMLLFDPKNPLSEAQTDQVGCILTGGSHLLELVNDILDLSGVEAGQISLSVEDVNANEVVADCLTMTRAIGERRGVALVDRFSAGPSSLLRTDRLRLKQVLLNLISNAIKFDKDGGTVTVTGRETEHGSLRICVTDTGVGVAKKDQPDVFQMFHRLGADPMKTSEGAGVGLAVSKLLVEQMAGRIGFDSEQGVGSAFWFELPLATNTESLIWTEAERIGVDVIDKDHQVIFSLMNKVARPLIGGNGAGGVEVDEIIDELIDYVHYHFSREEAIMQACGYPDLEAHRGGHRKLAARVDDLTVAWRRERDLETVRRLHRLLRGWWIGHITKVDARMAGYTKGKGQEIRLALKRLG